MICVFNVMEQNSHSVFQSLLQPNWKETNEKKMKITIMIPKMQIHSF